MNGLSKTLLALALVSSPAAASPRNAGPDFADGLSADEALLRAHLHEPSSFPLPPAGPETLGPLPSPLVGVTIDRFDDLSDTLGSLQAVARKPIVRLVFNEHTPAAEYRDAVARIHQVGYIMGQLLDSYFVKGTSAAEYQNRAVEYFDAFGGAIDLWEVGNEINGDWLGETADVRAKMIAGYDAIKSRGGRTALTLHYSSSYAKDPAHEPFRWAVENVPDDMKKGLDYAFISFYEVDSPGPPPDWNEVFSRLAKMFPNAKVGFGETGTEDAALKREVLRRYYGMKVSEPRYVGGGFWWFFSSDMVPASRPLLQDLNDVLREARPPLRP